MKINQWRYCALVAGVCGAASGVKNVSAAPAAPGDVVWQWNPANFHPAETNPWKIQTITAPDGATRYATSGTGQGYNNYLVVPSSKLLNGHDYTATLKYEIVTPTKFPASFYIFARSKKLGQSMDVWRNWSGDAGDKGTAKLVLSFKGDKAGDDWYLYGGCKGPGTMIIDSFQVTEGTGLDYVPAAAAAPAPAAAPAAAAAPATVKPVAMALPRGLMLPTGAKDFTLDPPSPKKGLVLSAKDFGMVADDATSPVSMEVAEANFNGFKAALKACKEQDASVLTFPKGVYRLSSREAIPITDLTDLTIDGQGSDFIFEKLRTLEIFSVYRCQRVVLKNFNVDWDWKVTPIASLAKVMSVAPDGLSAEMNFPDLSEQQIELVKKAEWKAVIPVDPATMVRKTNERAMVSVDSFENVDPTTLRVKFKTPATLKVGETYTIRHLYYESGAFKVGFSNNLLFDHVTIYSVPGMGWFFTGDMRNWKLTNCNIARRIGSRNPLTTAADGLHVSQSMGNFSMENCDFTGSGDDSVNIHDNCFQGVQRIDDTTLALVNCAPYRIRIQVGDKLELFRSNYAPLGFSSTVKTVAMKGNDTVVTLADTLPADLSPLTIVQNKRYDTNNVRIANCRFHDTNGRGLLLSARDATIENNTFKNVVGTAIQFETEIVDYLWAEGGGASNVVVRGNTFENTSIEGRYDNAVVYTGAKMPIGVTIYPLFHDILIEKNRFVNPSGPSVSLFSARNIIVRDNKIESPKTTLAANYLSSSLFAAYTTDVVFSGNTWKSEPEVGKSGVFFDPSTTSNVVSTGNLLAGP